MVNEIATIYEIHGMQHQKGGHWRREIGYHLMPSLPWVGLIVSPNPDKPEPKKVDPSLQSAKNPVRHTLRVFLALLETLLCL